MMNRSTRIQPFRLSTVMVAGVAALLLALVATAGAKPGNDNRAPDLGDCEDLRVPAGNKVAVHAYAIGVQIYLWTGTSWRIHAISLPLTYIIPDGSTAAPPHSPPPSRPG